jgi:hypothetical protein
MAKSRVMTLRIEPELLAELRRMARSEQRSVSAQVLHLVRKELAPTPRSKPLPTRGWLAHLDVPRDLAEFRRVRRALSRRIAERRRRLQKRR